MTAFNDKARQTAYEKYGGVEGYAAEMKRRSALRKTFAPGNGGFRWLQENDPERFAQIIAEREAKRKAKLNPSQDYDRTEET